MFRWNKCSATPMSIFALLTMGLSQTQTACQHVGHGGFKIDIRASTLAIILTRPGLGYLGDNLVSDVKGTRIDARCWLHGF